MTFCKNRLGILFFAVALVGPVARGQQLPDILIQYPELIVHNGKIVTLDDDSLVLPGTTGTVVSAMAVRDSRILLLGENDAVLRLAGPDTQVIDLEGRTVVPGLIEKHNHVSTAALNFHREGLELPFETTQVLGGSVEELLSNVRRRLEELKEEVEPGKFIWMSTPMEIGALAIARDVLNRDMLDQLMPDHPLFVAAPISSYTFNTAGRKVLDEYAPKYQGLPDKEVVGGRISQMMLAGALMQNRVTILAETIRRLLIHYASTGVTTTCSREHTPEAFNAFQLLNRLGRMEGRYAIVHHAEISGQRDWYRFYGDHSGLGNDYFWLAGVGLEGFDTFTADALCTDVTPIDPTVQEMYSRVKPCRGMKGEFERDQVQGMFDSGLRVLQTHGTADKTIDYFFEAIEEAMVKTGMTIEEVRAKEHALDHLGMVRPDQIPKFKYYGIIAGPDGTYKTAAGRVARWYGEEYVKWHQPVRSFIENGVYVANAADTYLSVERGTAWDNLYFLITRRINPGERTWNPEEAVDRITALKTQTVWGARYVGKDDIGSLQVENLADFLVLNKDYFTIAEDEIPTVVPVMTAVGGNIVFRDDSF